MKIGIITSGNDTLALFRFLQRYDHEYVIYYDFLNRSYGDKTFGYSLDKVEKGIGFLIKKGCEKIILPPVYELYFLQHANEFKIQNLESRILSLFQTYLQNFCFTHSLVGKLGMFGDYADIQIAQKLISAEAKKYTLNEHQKNIRKFHFPFSYRSKETSLWKYYLDELSYSEPMVNTVIKHDLRYFKDAGVDTVMPLNYGYFNYQNTIFKFFNYKKTRFHKIEKLEEIFVACKIPTSKKYSVSLWYTGHCDFLQRNKRLLRLLQRGEKTDIKCEEINYNLF